MQQTKAIIYVWICTFYTKYVTEEFESTNFQHIAVLEISINYITSKYYILNALTTNWFIYMFLLYFVTFYRSLSFDLR